MGKIIFNEKKGNCQRAPVIKMLHLSRFSSLSVDGKMIALGVTARKVFDVERLTFSENSSITVVEMETKSFKMLLSSKKEVIVESDEIAEQSELTVDDITF